MNRECAAKRAWNCRMLCKFDVTYYSSLQQPLQAPAVAGTCIVRNASRAPSPSKQDPTLTIPISWIRAISPSLDEGLLADKPIGRGAIKIFNGGYKLQVSTAAQQSFT
eukprot:GHUV01052008.1.p3 GENE.GHUV01052008.1~~GHUV01052008.1.p3  ORF type:complete len:108 (+),score=19.14 GHUV01052008.1:159-482(+)